HAVLDRIDPERVTALVVTGQLRSTPSTFKPFIERLHLTSTPVLASEDTMVYLADRDLVSALSRLEMSQLQTFSIADTTVVDSGNEMVRRRSVGSTIDPRIIGMLSPRPVIVVHPFGLSITQHNGRNVLNAHAPTDVLFNRPPQAKEVVADFGMDPACYDPKNHTDGVEFRVELVTKAGVHRTLDSVYLSPTERPIDRGEKTMRVELPADEEGQIWFRTLAGPKGSIACDWAYWARIEFK
ncbi:MAG TPA: hypothetical protein VL069_01180, partial [Opitutus sp.]|nr:hypothetical protein [Opitutus sp.]